MLFSHIKSKHNAETYTKLNSWPPRGAPNPVHVVHSRYIRGTRIRWVFGVAVYANKTDATIFQGRATTCCLRCVYSCVPPDVILDTCNVRWFCEVLRNLLRATHRGLHWLVDDYDFQLAASDAPHPIRKLPYWLKLRATSCGHTHCRLNGTYNLRLGDAYQMTDHGTRDATCGNDQQL